MRHDRGVRGLFLILYVGLSAGGRGPLFFAYNLFFSKCFQSLRDRVTGLQILVLLVRIICSITLHFNFYVAQNLFSYCISPCIISLHMHNIQSLAPHNLILQHHVIFNLELILAAYFLGERALFSQSAFCFTSHIALDLPRVTLIFLQFYVPYFLLIDHHFIWISL